MIKIYLMDLRNSYLVKFREGSDGPVTIKEKDLQMICNWLITISHHRCIWKSE